MLVPQLTERLRDAENESMAKIAELEKQLSQARKESETLRVRLRGSGLGGNKGWPGLPRTDHLGLLGLTRPSTPGREWGLRARLARGSQPLPRGSQERFSESTPMGTSRRSSEPEKVAAPAPARPSALELKAMLFLLRPHDGAAGPPRRGPQARRQLSPGGGWAPRSDREKGLYPGADSGLRWPESSQ